MSNIHVELNTRKYQRKRLDRWVENMKSVANVLDVFKSEGYASPNKYSIYTVLIKGMGTEKLNDMCVKDLNENHPEVEDAHDTRFDRWTLN
jgi:hypothetical protein